MMGHPTLTIRNSRELRRRWAERAAATLEQSIVLEALNFRARRRAMQVRVHNHRRGNNRPQQRSLEEVALSGSGAGSSALRPRVATRVAFRAPIAIPAHVPSFISAAADLLRHGVCLASFRIAKLSLEVAKLSLVSTEDLKNGQFASVLQAIMRPRLCYPQTKVS